MSYDISFKVKVEGIDHYIDLDCCDANITWNVREIITRSTGLPWENEANNGLVKDIVPAIRNGLTELERNGDAYKQYEASNGWGHRGGRHSVLPRSSPVLGRPARG